MIVENEIRKDTSLPPGKEGSVRFSIIRPLKIESLALFFAYEVTDDETTDLLSGICPIYDIERTGNAGCELLYFGRHIFCGERTGNQGSCRTESGDSRL